MAARRPPVLLGRATEREALDRLLENVRGGQSAVLVIRGEAGVGKTALLHHCARQASGFRVARLAGVESEMELPFAALHQLCAPMLDRLDALPPPQQGALCVAFGLESGAAPDRFLVALAALSLLAEVAGERPLLCFVDDAQWLDADLGPGARLRRATAAGRVGGDRVRAFATRPTSASSAGLPELTLSGLPEDEARALLATVIPGRLDERVRDRFVAETRGNPLAILELPRALAATRLPGGLGLDEGAYAVPGPHRGELPGAARGAPRRTPGCCCWWRQRSRSTTRCWCGARPSGSASSSRRRRPTRRMGCWPSASG